MSPSTTFSGTYCTVPGQVTNYEVSTTAATSISLSWSVPTGSVVTQYLVEWQRDTSDGCSDEDEGSVTVTGTFTIYTITGLTVGTHLQLQSPTQLVAVEAVTLSLP